MAEAVTPASAPAVEEATPASASAAPKAGAKASAAAGRKAINLNIGVLGHIDSGKTSLCRALSTVTSTASLDKHPQSQERGITLDLGFSSFSSDAPEHFKAEGYDEIQFCLVDCPGHASLIRTVIGGAQIIDLMTLVLDVNKGIQTQTAECLVVAEMLANQLVIILNKVDMIPEAKRAKTLDKVIKQLRITFERTKFGSGLQFACTAASPQDGAPPLGVSELIETLKAHVNVPKRDCTGPFMFSFDHAFQIRGQGTVLTGTVLSGAAKPGQNIEVPALGEAGRGKKIRSLQMFKQPVQHAGQGDRVAICVPSLEAKDLERGLLVDAKYSVPLLDACICVVDRISYFKQQVKTKAKFHMSLGHQTVMATVHFFCPLESFSAVLASHKEAVARAAAAGDEAAAAGEGKKGQKSFKSKDQESKTPSLAMGCGALVADRQKDWPTTFDTSRNYLHLDELFQHGAPVEYENNDGDIVSLAAGKETGCLLFSLHGEFKREITELRFDVGSGGLRDQDNVPVGATVDSLGVVPLKDRDRVIYLLAWLAQNAEVPGLPHCEEPLAFGLVLLERPVLCPMGSLLIGSKLDFDNHCPSCRLCFFGRILTKMDPKDLKTVRLVKMKSKTGFIDRFDKQDKLNVIVRDLFKEDTDLSLFLGLKVVHETSGTEGVLEGAFGQEGKVRVRFPCELKVQEDKKGHVKGNERITLFFKKYDFEKSSRIIQ